MSKRGILIALGVMGFIAGAVALICYLVVDVMGVSYERPTRKIDVIRDGNYECIFARGSRVGTCHRIKP